MCGTTARQQLNVPLRLTSSTSSQASGGYSQVRTLGPAIPALLTRMSTRSNAASVASRARSTASSTVTSTAKASIRPRAFSSTAALSESLASRSQMAIAAPESRNRCAMARPIPCAPPVTTATRPERSIWFMLAPVLKFPQFISEPPSLSLPPCGGGQSHVARCLEVATRVPLAPPLPACGERSICERSHGESEANRVRGLVHKLRLAATPPPPDSFAGLGIRPLPARGERWRKWHCLAPQLKCDSPALWGRGVPTSEHCAHTRHAIPYPAWGLRRSPRISKARAQAPPPLAQEGAHVGCELFHLSARSVDVDRQRTGAADRRRAAPRRA